jgi:hypothetical protein
VAQPALAEMAALPLRKALFARDESARVVAAHGLVLLLAHTSAPGGGGGSGGGLTVDEVLGLLRRCLTQQASVRGVVYRGLADAFAAQPSLRARIFAFVAAHARQYLPASGSSTGGGGGDDLGLPCVEVDRCVASLPLPHVAEPLGELLTCVASMAALVSVTGAVSAVGRVGGQGETRRRRGEVLVAWPDATAQLSRLATILASADLASFSLDKTCDFTQVRSRQTRR